MKSRRTLSYFFVTLTVIILTIPIIILIIKIQGIDRLLGFMGFFANAIAGFITWAVASRTSKQETHSTSDLSPLQQKNRERLLEKVHLFWINGVLEKSLYAEARLELGMVEKPEAVENPWDLVLQRPDQPNRTLPRGTKIIEVFDSITKELLILGEPGSGKTTTLLELARDLIVRAVKDEAQPIPIVFNLSTWATERKPLGEWLISELNLRYQIPKNTAKQFIQNDQLALLLDGLDEVQEAYRYYCVEAINDFHTEHTVEMVVCSRVSDYLTLTTKLRLQGAIVLQPLTAEKIDKFLDSLGSKVAIMRDMLKNHEELRVLGSSPLMLNVMRVAYEDVNIPADAARLPFVLGEARLFDPYVHLFGIYVKRMFERRGNTENYTPEQTKHWIVWLARKMNKNQQSVFNIEELQPTWLDKEKRRIYSIILGFLGGLYAIMVFTPITTASLLIQVNTFSRVLMTIGVIGWVWMFVWIAQSREKNSLSGLLEPHITTVEFLSFSWADFTANIHKSLLDMPLAKHIAKRKFIGIFIAIIILLFILTTIESGVSTGLLLLFYCFACVILMFLMLAFSELISGNSVKRSQLESKFLPNQGIRISVRNSILVGLLFGMPIALFLALLNIAAKTDIPILIPSLSFGTLFAFVYGGLAVIQHFILRLLLFFAGSIPWNYRQFLDYAAERVFLRKVGGGYIFVHRLLLEYFAGLEDDEPVA